MCYTVSVLGRYDKVTDFEGRIMKEDLRVFCGANDKNRYNLDIREMITSKIQPKIIPISRNSFGNNSSVDSKGIMKPTTDIPTPNIELDEIVTFGILVADWQMSKAREYIIDYMNRFDQKSGKYIDFMVLGYGEDSKSQNKADKAFYNRLKKHGPAFYLKRNETEYYFDKLVFDDLVREIEERMGIKYTYNPMLILVEGHKNRFNGELEFQDRMVIELDKVGIERVGMLFDKIFELSKETNQLTDISHGLIKHYIKGNSVSYIFKGLKGNWLDSAEEFAKAVKFFAIQNPEE